MLLQPTKPASTAAQRKDVRLVGAQESEAPGPVVVFRCWCFSNDCIRRQQQRFEPAVPLPPALSFANEALSTFLIASFAVDSVADFSYFERIMGKLSRSTWLVSVQGITRLKVQQPFLHCCHSR